jgi:hypothetical protein
VQSSFPLSRALAGLSIVPIIVLETFGAAKPADISLNIRSIFVRAEIGHVIALVPKQLGDGLGLTWLSKPLGHEAAEADGMIERPPTSATA